MINSLYLFAILTSLAIVQARYLARAAVYSGVPSWPNLLSRSSGGKRTAALAGSISRNSSSSIRSCMIGWCNAAVRNTCQDQEFRYLYCLQLVFPAGNTLSQPRNYLKWKSILMRQAGKFYMTKMSISEVPDITFLIPWPEEACLHMNDRFGWMHRTRVAANVEESLRRQAVAPSNVCVQFQKWGIKAGIGNFHLKNKILPWGKIFQSEI